MNQCEKESLEASIAKSEEALRKGLIIDPEAASQIRRMIWYYKEKIKTEYVGDEVE